MGYVINPYEYEAEEYFNAALEMDNYYYMCPSLKHYAYARNIRNGAYNGSSINIKTINSSKLSH